MQQLMDIFQYTHWIVKVLLAIVVMSNVWWAAIKGDHKVFGIWFLNFMAVMGYIRWA